MRTDIWINLPVDESFFRPKMNTGILTNNHIFQIRKAVGSCCDESNSAFDKTRKQSLFCDQTSRENRKSFELFSVFQTGNTFKVLLKALSRKENVIELWIHPNDPVHARRSTENRAAEEFEGEIAGLTIDA